MQLRPLRNGLSAMLPGLWTLLPRDGRTEVWEGQMGDWHGNTHLGTRRGIRVQRPPARMPRARPSSGQRLTLNNTNATTPRLGTSSCSRPLARSLSDCSLPHRARLPACVTWHRLRSQFRARGGGQLGAGGANEQQGPVGFPGTEACLSTMPYEQDSSLVGLLRVPKGREVADRRRRDTTGPSR